MARYASMVVVATSMPHQTANIYRFFYTMYVPRVPARLSSRAACSEVALVLGCWLSHPLSLSILRLRPKERDWLSMHRGSFTSNYCYFWGKTQKLPIYMSVLLLVVFTQHCSITT
jgi:hypothetical protein